MPQIVPTLEEALAPITDGCVLAVPRERTGVAMAATRALIRRGVKRLHLVALPTSSLQADLLIGAGCIATLETSAVSLGEFGPAPRFSAAITAGIWPTGMPSSTRSAPSRASAQPVAIRSMTPCFRACSKGARVRPMPTTRRVAGADFSASANDPPISPTPQMTTLSNRIDQPNASSSASRKRPFSRSRPMVTRKCSGIA